MMGDIVLIKIQEYTGIRGMIICLMMKVPITNLINRAYVVICHL